MGSDNDGKGGVTRYLVDLSIWGTVCEGEHKLNTFSCIYMHMYMYGYPSMQHLIK